MSTLTVFTLLVAFAVLSAGLSAFAARRLVRRRANARQATGLTPISVMKPLCGADDALEGNLESFFRQDYPRFELVFGVEGDQDPAIDVVRRLSQRYPDVRCKLVIHDGRRGINPKVANLRAILDAVKHDVVLISDSNVMAPPNYLGDTVAVLEEQGVGLVSNMFAGTGERTVGATLDNLQLNGTIASGVALSHLLSPVGSPPLVVGKSMMFRRSVFESLGGFESVATVLAEDYIMGRMFHAAGYAVRIAPVALENVNQSVDVKGFWRRHLRWNMLRTRIKPALYAIEPLTSPVVWAAIAFATGTPVLAALALGIGAAMLRDGLMSLVLRGKRDLARAMLFAFVKEVIMLGVWAKAPFCKHVAWRGHRVRLSAGTRLYAQNPVGPRHAARIFEPGTMALAA